jgi:hypothetical protein
MKTHRLLGFLTMTTSKLSIYLVTDKQGVRATRSVLERHSIQQADSRVTEHRCARPNRKERDCPAQQSSPRRRAGIRK